MRKINILLISSLCVGFIAACNKGGTVLEGDPLQGGLTAAKQLFIEDVRPILAADCADCHSNPEDIHGAPDFLDAVPGDYYESLVKRKDFVSCNVDNSLLLVHGENPDHLGGPLSPPQHDRVKLWLMKEATDRYGGTCKNSTPTPGGSGGSGQPMTPEGPLTGREALEQFGDCMTLEDWKETGMYLVASQTALYNKEQTPCYSCHYNGTGSNWMADPTNDADVAVAFENMRHLYGIFNLVRWSIHDEEGSFEDIAQSYRWRDKRKDQDHPPFELDSEYLAIIDAWFDLTYEKWKAGPCMP